MKKMNAVMKERSRELRTNATREENTLWYQFLKTYPVSWYRQRVIGSYIADFYCKSVKLLIEIDGSQHYEEDSMSYDRERTAYFDSLGIEVIRFTNTEINKQFHQVCQFIDLKVKMRQGVR